MMLFFNCKVFLSWSEDVRVILEIILRLIISTFSMFSTYLFFQAQILSNYIGSRYLVSTIPPTVLCQSL